MVVGQYPFLRIFMEQLTDKQRVFADAMGKLPEKLQIFVNEYLIDLNATRAGLRAGYSEKTAKSQASRLLTNIDVQAAFQAGMAARSERTGIDQDKVLQSIANLAFYDPRDVVNWANCGIFIKNSEELTAEQARMVTEVSRSVTKSGDVVINVKLADRSKYIKMLGDHLGLFQQKIQLTGEGGGPVQMMHMTKDEYERIAKEIAESV